MRRENQTESGIMEPVEAFLRTQQQEHAPDAAALAATLAAILTQTSPSPVAVTTPAAGHWLQSARSSVLTMTLAAAAIKDDDEQLVFASNSAGNVKKRPPQDRRPITPSKKARLSDPPPPASSVLREPSVAVTQAPRPTDKPESDESLNGHVRELLAQIAHLESKSKHEELLVRLKEAMKQDFDRKALQLTIQHNDEVHNLKAQITALKWQAKAQELTASQIREAIAENSCLRAEFQTYRKMTSNIVATNSHLRCQLSLASAESDRLRSRLQKTRAQLTVASAETGKLRAQLSKTQAEIRDERIMPVQQEAVRWKNECKVARAELQKHREIDSKAHKAEQEKREQEVCHLRQAVRSLRNQLERSHEMASSEAEKRGDKTLLLDEWTKQQTETRVARSLNAMARASTFRYVSYAKQRTQFPVNKDDIDDSSD